MLKALLKPLGVAELLKGGGYFEFSTGELADNDSAPAEWVAGYIQRILHEDRRQEIMTCWTQQKGLKETFDQMYKEMRNPYTHVFNHKQVREEVFPVIQSGLDGCKDGALEAFIHIQEMTDSRH